MRICLVTPFAWSQPHDVNEHVAGVAQALRARGHDVTVLAPSTRARRPAAPGGRALHHGGPVGEMIAVGPAVPISRRSQMGVPVGVRANLSLALAQGALRRRPRLRARPAVALVPRAARHRRAHRRHVLLARPALLPARALAAREAARPARRAASRSRSTTRDAAAERFPGDYRLVSPGVDPALFAPTPKRQLDRRRAAAERARRRPQRAPRAARAARLGGRAAADEAARSRGRRSRATSPTRVRVRTARDGASRAALLNEAAIFVPGLDGLARVLLEAQAAGCAIAAPRGVEDQPELAGAAVAQARRGRRAARRRAGARARRGRRQLVRRRRRRARAALRRR